MFILKGLYGVFETVYDYAMEELYDIQRIKQKIMELQILLELGEIEEEEYSEREKVLLQQLRDAQEYHRAQLEEEDDE